MVTAWQSPVAAAILVLFFMELECDSGFGGCHAFGSPTSTMGTKAYTTAKLQKKCMPYQMLPLNLAREG